MRTLATTQFLLSAIFTLGLSAWATPAVGIVVVEETVVGTVTQDFDGGGDAFTVHGSASAPVPAVTGNAGQLTPAVNNQNGRIAFDQTLAGTGYNTIRGGFDFRAEPGSGQADGFSFNLLSTGAFGTSGDFTTLGVAEHGETNGGFGIGFNIHQGGADLSNNSIYLSNEIGGTQQEQVHVAAFDFSTSEFHRAEFEIEFLDLGGANVSLSLIQDVNGAANGPFPVFVDEFFPTLDPIDARLGFIGRTGGQNALQQFDNLFVEFLLVQVVPEPGSFALLGLGLVGLARRRRSRLVRNVVAIAR